MLRGSQPRCVGGSAESEYEPSAPWTAPSSTSSASPAIVGASGIRSAPPTPLQKIRRIRAVTCSTSSECPPNSKSSAPSPLVPLPATPAKSPPASPQPRSAEPRALPYRPAVSPPQPATAARFTFSCSKEAAARLLASNWPAPCVPAVSPADSAATLPPTALLCQLLSPPHTRSASAVRPLRSP